MFKIGLAKTRDGRSVRILCIDAKRDFPIIGLVMEGGREWSASWSSRGIFNLNYTPSGADLQPPTVWLNIYKSIDGWDYCANAYDTKEEALANTGRGLVTTVEVQL